MKIIESTTKKDKKTNLITYSFNVNNEKFVTHYIYGAKPRFELFHNGTMIGFSDQIKNKFTFSVDTDYENIKITIWIEYSNYGNIIGKLNGLGIDVNGNPVQNSLTDPDTHINYAKNSFYILAFIMTVSGGFTYYNAYKTYLSHFDAFFTSSIYILFLILIIISFFVYKKWTMFSLITGSIISLIDFIDYGVSLPNILMNSASPNVISIIIWIAMRFSVLFMFFNAFKWRKKRKLYKR
jgi:hypothetical protein